MRARFSTPELQSGKVTPEEAYKVLENDVVLSHAFAQEEVERFTLPLAGAGEQLFLRVYEAAAIAQRYGGGAGAEVRSEEVPRLPAGAGIVAARPDAQGGDGGLCAVAEEVGALVLCDAGDSSRVPCAAGELHGLLGLEQGDGGTGGVGEDGHPADVGDFHGAFVDGGAEGFGLFGGGVDVFDADVG